MYWYPLNQKEPEDPFLSAYAEETYLERYEQPEKEEEPWAIYDPF